MQIKIHKTLKIKLCCLNINSITHGIKNYRFLFNEKKN